MSNPPKLTDDEIAALAARTIERQATLPEVSAKMSGQTLQLTIGTGNTDEDRIRLMAALGVADISFLSALMTQLANAMSSKTGVSEMNLRFALNTVASIKPNDEIEAMLAAQMAAVHACAMDTSRRYMNSESLPGKDSAERALNKLTRTFATQMETLKRYRSKGQQVVRVERVTVHEGGQAIVGAVSHGGRGRDEGK
jgi:hypothetical protein